MENLNRVSESVRKPAGRHFGLVTRVAKRLGKDLSKQLEGRGEDEICQAESLLSDAKIDVNEYFAGGKTAADFEATLAAAQTPLELAISELSTETPDADLGRLLEPILAEVRRLDPIEQDRHLRLIQNRCGKNRVTVATLRRQMKVVRIDAKSAGKRRQSAASSRSSGAQPALATAISDDASGNWRDKLLLNLNGTVRPLLANAITALRGAPEWAGVLVYDDFALRTAAQRPAPWMGSEFQPPFTWTTSEDVLTANWLQHQGIYVPPHVAGPAVEVVAKEHRIHPVREYLQSLRWDGTSRLRSWLTTYLGVEPSSYAMAVGTRWMISAVARIFSPGVKADTCLILEGPQGIKKSTALRVLGAPWFTDQIAELGSKDAALQIRGVWIVEIAELDSMARTEVGRVKGFMSCQSDNFRPPYDARPIDSPRQCIFAGSVNHAAYLRDETGNRRFWPVECKAAMIDVDGLAAAKDQLWAEAVYSHFEGKAWWLDTIELTREAEVEQSARYEGDPWDELILKWAEGRDSISIADVLTNCLEKRKDQWTQTDKNRVARCLRVNGWERFKSGPRAVREWRYRRQQEGQ